MLMLNHLVLIQFFDLINFHCHYILGESMQPTLYSNNVLICDKTANRLNNYNRNDIIIAIHPHQPSSLICKRLVALPGDIVMINSVQQKDRKDDDSPDTLEKVYITPGSCWIEGDNRVNSTDSRNYGQISMGLIRSKVLARIWPPSDFRIF